MAGAPDTTGRRTGSVFSLRARAFWLRARTGAASVFLHPGDPVAHDPASLRAHRWKIARRWIAWGALCAVVLATLMVPLALLLALRPPAWWLTVDAMSDATTALAGDLEGTLVEQASLVRPTAVGFESGPKSEWRSDPWTVTISQEHANAWLAARFPVWLANRAERTQWPPQLRGVQTRFLPGRVVVGAQLDIEGSERFVGAEFRLGVRDDGSLWTKTEWLSLGRLPLPAGWLMRRAADDSAGFLPRALGGSPESAAALKALIGDAAVAMTPALSLGDGRRVRLLAIEPGDGVLKVTCRTELSGK